MQPGAITMLSLTITAFMSGVPLNVFIMAVSFRAWIKGRQQSPADLILFVLGTFNNITLSIQCFSSIIHFLVVDVSSSVGMYFIYAFFCSTFLSSSLVTAWLCTFYCIKIVTFQHRLISHLKLRFSKLLPWLLSGSIILSFSLMSLLLVITMLYVPFINFVNNTEHYSREQISGNRNIDLFMYGLDAAACIPLLLTVVSLGLTVTSLILHVLRLHRGSLNMSFSQAKAHVNAAITMTLLLMLQLMYFLTLMNNTIYPSYIGTAWFWFSKIIYYYFYMLLALILILGNRKLSRACGVFGCPLTEKTSK